MHNLRNNNPPFLKNNCNYINPKTSRIFLAIIIFKKFLLGPLNSMNWQLCIIILSEVFQKQGFLCILKISAISSAFENVADGAIVCPFKRCYYQDN
jgi:hypothetical protein